MAIVKKFCQKMDNLPPELSIEGNFPAKFVFPFYPEYIKKTYNLQRRKYHADDPYPRKGGNKGEKFPLFGGSFSGFFSG